LNDLQKKLVDIGVDAKISLDRNFKKGKLPVVITTPSYISAKSDNVSGIFYHSRGQLSPTGDAFTSTDSKLYELFCREYPHEWSRYAIYLAGYLVGIITVCGVVSYAIPFFIK